MADFTSDFTEDFDIENSSSGGNKGYYPPALHRIPTEVFKGRKRKPVLLNGDEADISTVIAI